MVERYLYHTDRSNPYNRTKITYSNTPVRGLCILKKDLAVVVSLFFETIDYSIEFL